LLDPDGLWDYALKTLARRAHSAGELRAKLARRAQEPQDVAAVLGKLREYGLADDAKFSETYAVSRMQNEGFGRLRVLRELRAKRVAGPVAARAVEKTFAETNESELIEQFLSRKYRKVDLRQYLSEEKNLANAYRRLVAAGFSGRGALSVLKRFSRLEQDWEEAPDEPDPP
jgi:regulatory protein